MKKLILSILAVLVSAITFAQVPNDMMYQVMAVDQTTGQIKSNKVVVINIQLHQGSVTGDIVWQQEFKTKTNKAGICNLALSYSDSIDWDKGPYYLGVIIDGEKAGAPKITSVPYALKAKSLEGVITLKELLGTWKGTVKESPYTTTWTYTFNADGTYTYTFVDSDGKHSDERNAAGTYYVTKSGVIAIKKSNGYWELLNAIKINDNEIVINEGATLTKQ